MFTIRPAPSLSAARVRPNVSALSSRQIGVRSRDWSSASSTSASPGNGCSIMSRPSASSASHGPESCGSYPVLPSAITGSVGKAALTCGSTSRSQPGSIFTFIRQKPWATRWSISASRSLTVGLMPKLSPVGIPVFTPPTRSFIGTPSLDDAIAHTAHSRPCLAML